MHAGVLLDTETRTRDEGRTFHWMSATSSRRRDLATEVCAARLRAGNRRDGADAPKAERVCFAQRTDARAGRRMQAGKGAEVGRGRCSVSGSEPPNGKRGRPGQGLKRV